MNSINFIAIDRHLTAKAWQEFLKKLTPEEIRELHGHIIGIEKRLFPNKFVKKNWNIERQVKK